MAQQDHASKNLRAVLDREDNASSISYLYYKGKLIILDEDDEELGAEGQSSGQSLCSTFDLRNLHSTPPDPYGMSNEAKYSDCDLWGYLNATYPSIGRSKRLSMGCDGYVVHHFRSETDCAWKISLSAKGGYCWLIIEKVEEELAQALSN
ncbi:hypothetical protein [Porphyromonas sp.]